ncbi:hypothetical protein GZH47_25450 [Paenibacillus rhizovicinus]|uniref:DUF3221 domain-containing protein n=1 Tax=Paenibacillus rhizovicinus TaxID=2704463 RepID=A0A6C0PB64_9BACL|nr:hypothetical protein [Paenibacillus rhizovicinus]QHW33812.1 hypothetical protein GZH47_25450 [Paenibacillus rhizovicinus]
MRTYGVVGLILFFTLLVGCGSHEEAVVQPTTEASVTKGDFTYRLVTAKPEYSRGESVPIYAELTYIGDEASVTINHSASPFYFPIQELKRGYVIDYAMSDVGASTKLIKGQPMRGTFNIRGGGYSENDPTAYKDFIDNFRKNGYDKGHYAVNGYADFSLAGQKVRIDAQIDFLVD